MEKIPIERHDAAYRIDSLTRTEGSCPFHVRQKHIPGRLLPLIRRSLHTKQAVTLCRASDQDDWMILFPLNEEAADVIVRATGVCPCCSGRQAIGWRPHHPAGPQRPQRLPWRMPCGRARTGVSIHTFYPYERVPQHARGTQTRGTMATPDHLSLYLASPV